MTDEPIDNMAPLAVVAARQPSSTVYERATRLAHSRLWIFTVSYIVSAFFLIIALLEIPSYYEEASADMLLTLNGVMILIGAVLLILQTIGRKKAQNESYQRAVRREGALPTVYRFYADRVETISLRSRVMMPYAEIISAVEDSHGFYLSNGELIVLVPAAGLTAYDANVIRQLLQQHLPANVYRRHRALSGKMAQPHAIPLYPDRPVIPPQVLHHAEYERPFAQTFITLLTSTFPMLLLLTPPVSTMLILLCGVSTFGAAAAVYLSVLLLSLFPLYLFAKRNGPMLKPPLGLSVIEGGWRLYRREGEWLLLPEDVLIRRIGDTVRIVTPYGELLTDVDSCRAIPELATKIGL